MDLMFKVEKAGADVVAKFTTDWATVYFRLLVQKR